MAYRLWFQQDAEIHSFERHFVHYLFEGAVPFWVRHFLRRHKFGKRRGLTHKQSLTGGYEFLRLAMTLSTRNPTTANDEGRMAPELGGPVECRFIFVVPLLRGVCLSRSILKGGIVVSKEPHPTSNDVTP